jgi:DNA-nicking Smr family endonuclease
MRALVVEGLRFETLDDGERIEGRRIDVEPRELRRLRHGKFAVDGKLDLHGHGAHEARQALEAFIKKRALDGDRVVLVVHGKGSHSPRGHGVLRGEIAAWLSQGRSARHVAAFASAPEDEGGSGAVLVLLAR